MLIHKKSLLFLGLLCLGITIKASFIDPSGFIDTETGDFLNAQGGVHLDPEVQNAVTAAQAAAPAPTLTSEVITGFRKAVLGQALTPKENTLIGGIFTTIDVINTFHDFLAPIAGDGTPVASLSDVALFIVKSAGRAVYNGTNALKQLFGDLTAQGGATANPALTKGIVKYLAQALIQYQDHQTLEEAQAAGTALAMAARMMTGETTIKDRIYIKIVNAITKSIDWIRNVFGKKSIRDGFHTDLFGVILDETHTRSAYERILAGTEAARRAMEDPLQTLKDAGEWTGEVLVEGCRFAASRIRTAAGTATAIVGQMVETAQNASATLMYEVIDATGKAARDAYSVTANTAQAAVDAAKAGGERIMKAAADATDAVVSNAVALKNGAEALAGGVKDATIECVHRSFMYVDSILKPIYQSFITGIISEQQAATALLLIATVASFNNMDLNELETTPSEDSIPADINDMYDGMAALFGETDSDILDALEKMAGDDTTKLEAAIVYNKNDIMEIMFTNLSTPNLVDPKGNYKFDINELAKDDIAILITKIRINDLLATASSTDRKTLNKLLTDLDTAVINRPRILSPEDQTKYDALIEELKQYSALGEESDLLNWCNKELTPYEYDLIKDDITTVIFKDTIAQSTASLDATLSVDQLIELKKIFNDFIIESENFGYGESLLTATSLAKRYQDILTAAGINSQVQKQLILDNLTVVESLLTKKLINDYNGASDKLNWLDSITTKNSSIAFDALSNEGKIDFLNGLADLIQTQRDTYIANALQHVIDQAGTADDLLILQKETFAQHDILLQALQDKIKGVLTDFYKELPEGSDQDHFKDSLLNPKDFTDYSRAFKTLSLADQQAIAGSFNINSAELMTFQKTFLADKLFYVKTFDEMNSLRRDIKAFNDKTANYFTNADIAGKHGFIVIGDAVTAQSQRLIEEKINKAAVANKDKFSDSKDYFKKALLDMSSGDVYAIAFRQLSLTAQHELAQKFGIDQDPVFKSFQKAAFNAEVGVATSPTELAALQHIAQSLGLDTADINAVTARLNKAVASGVATEDPAARHIALDPNDIVANPETPDSGAGHSPVPTPSDIDSQFDQQSLSNEDFHDAYETEEERKESEERYQEQKIAEETEKRAEEAAARETHPDEHASTNKK